MIFISQFIFLDFQNNLFWAHPSGVVARKSCQTKPKLTLAPVDLEINDSVMGSLHKESLLHFFSILDYTGGSYELCF